MVNLPCMEPFILFKEKDHLFIFQGTCDSGRMLCSFKHKKEIKTVAVNVASNALQDNKDVVKHNATFHSQLMKSKQVEESSRHKPDFEQTQDQEDLHLIPPSVSKFQVLLDDHSFSFLRLL